VYADEYGNGVGGALVKKVVDKVQCRKLDVTAVAGVEAAVGAIDLTWLMAAVAIAYVVSEAAVDATK